jgi:phage terminase small subunit
MGLSPKRKMFVEAYLKTFNATQAALDAGYSPKTARSQGARLLTFVDIAAEIKKRLDEMVMSADEVLRLLSRQANASHKSWVKVDKDGRIYFDFSDPEAQENLDLIKKIKTKTRHEREGKKDFEVEWVEVELYDSQRALELIGKHHGIFVDRHEITGEVVLKQYENVSPDDWDEKKETE